MATLILQTAGAALGSVFGPAGAALGRAAGALLGNVVDHRLLSPQRVQSAPHLSAARFPAAAEGAPISRLYGSMRLSGTLIWATRFEEEVTRERRGAKATRGPKVESFRYYANFALGLCEGEAAHLRRVWADGRELDLSGIEMRFYRGDERQQPDPLIEAKQGRGKTPAYRGLCYVVFERLPLAPYGNRIPLLQFEVLRPLGALERDIEAVCLLPGATEHGLSAEPVSESLGPGAARCLNRNRLSGETDLETSLDELQALCPKLKRVALVTAWFGSDLVASRCRIEPGVEVAERSESRAWRVSGLSRGQARLVSRIGAAPAYGGTPDDQSVVSAIRALRRRGLKVYLYPFLLMDIPPGNARPDPQGGAEQPAFAWRGRITCHPAPQRPGSPDRSKAIVDEIAAFCGKARLEDFQVAGERVDYRGKETSYRRFILHYALLARAAGGVDGFLVGSELPGLTRLRDEADRFPFVSALAALCAEVKAILPQTALTYAADWTEYGGYSPGDGSGDLYFPLDPLWASPDIAAVGIDNYLPLSDWRDSDLVEGNPDGFSQAEDPAALERQIRGGEYFDWFYADATDRAERRRRPISDGAHDKPWVFRRKDLFGWWSNAHVERRGGREIAQATAWRPRMKPLWFTELGCAAVDKGANQPNVFPDPKSAENALPHFSSGRRADSLQRRALEAHLRHWKARAEGEGMVDPAHIFLWCWDARPYPAFPERAALWSDGANWRTGHWLNGRLGAGTLAEVIGALLTDAGFTDFDIGGLAGDLTGYVQSGLDSPRAMIEPLLVAYGVDVFEDGGKLVFRSRRAAALPAQPVLALVDRKDHPLYREKRGDEADFAAEAVLSYLDPATDYAPASRRSRRIAGAGAKVLAERLAAALPEETALSLAEHLLRDHRLARRRISFALPPEALDLRPGDVLRLPEGPQGRFLVTAIEEAGERRIEAEEWIAPVEGPPPALAIRPDSGGPNAGDLFQPLVFLLDLPRLGEGPAGSFARGAALTRPFRPVALSASPSAEGYRARLVLDRPAILGRLAAPLVPGVAGRFDFSQTLLADLAFGAVSSAGRDAVLAGANRLALLRADGRVEILGFLEAMEVSPGRFRLSGLLRGLFGSEDAMADTFSPGSALVLLDEAVLPLGFAAEECGQRLNWLAENAVGEGRFGPIAFAGGLRAETPLAPVHLRARRRADGGVRLSWIRRGRLSAEDWAGPDIPLDEPFERYQVELLAGGRSLRRAETDMPHWIYDAAEERADFGAPQRQISVRVRQMGQRVALGLPAERVLAVEE